jgi:hypothetical protein
MVVAAVGLDEIGSRHLPSRPRHGPVISRRRSLPLGEVRGDGGKEPAAGQYRAEQVQSRAAVGSRRGQECDWEHEVPGVAGSPRREAVMPGQSSASPAAFRHRGPEDPVQSRHAPMRLWQIP